MDFSTAQGEKEAALDIYDKEVKQRYKSGAMLDLVDAASLLYRLQLEGNLFANPISNQQMKMII